MSDAVTISLINTIGTSLVAILGIWINRNVKKYHKEVNGHMTKLLALTAKDSKAEGVAEQKATDESIQPRSNDKNKM